jgi:cytochrome c5
MRQSHVNRSVLVLSGVFVGACIAFAVAVEPGPPAAPATDVAPATDMAPGDTTPAVDVSAGARLYEMRCERCHTLDESLAPLREAAPGTDARADYLRMLQRHRKSAAEENAPITDYLQSQMSAIDQQSRPDG